MNRRLNEVLAAINDLRAELGLEPLDAIPSGRRNDPSYCPVAKALNRPDQSVRIWVTYGYWVTLREQHPLSPVLVKFIRAFDDNTYPELIDDNS